MKDLFVKRWKMKKYQTYHYSSLFGVHINLRGLKTFGQVKVQRGAPQRIEMTEEANFPS